MSMEEYSHLIIDTGADVSLFKINKINSNQHVSAQNKINLTGITTHTIDTLATTFTTIQFGETSVKHQFHLIPKELDIGADGILGREFFANYRCVIDYEHWLLNFTHNGMAVWSRSTVVNSYDLTTCPSWVQSPNRPRRHT